MIFSSLIVDKTDPNVDGVEYLDDISRLKDTDVDCAIVCTPTSTILIYQNNY